MGGRDRGALRVPVASARAVGGLDPEVHDHQPVVDRRRAASLPAQPGARRGLPGRGAWRCGTSPTRLRSRRPSWRPGSTRGTSTASPSTQPTGPVYVETTRPELVPACVALVAHPDDERFQAHVRHHGSIAVVRRRGPRAGAPPRPSRTRAPASRWSAPSATSPTSSGGASCSCRSRSVVGRDGRLARDTPDWLTTEAGGRRTPRWPARRRSQRSTAIVDALRASGDLDGEPTPTLRNGQLLRERRQAAGDRHQPAVVHPKRRSRRGSPRDIPRTRGGAALGARRTCDSATTAGSAASTATG